MKSNKKWLLVSSFCLLKDRIPRYSITKDDAGIYSFEKTPLPKIKGKSIVITNIYSKTIFMIISTAGRSDSPNMPNSTPQKKYCSSEESPKYISKFVSLFKWKCIFIFRMYLHFMIQIKLKIKDLKCNCFFLIQGWSCCNLNKKVKGHLRFNFTKDTPANIYHNSIGMSYLKIQTH